MEIRNNKLTGPEVKQYDCPKNSQPLRSLKYIVLHGTDGYSADSSALYLARPEVKASAHLVVGRDGKVFQLVDFATQAWHAGVSMYEGHSGLNALSAGIELDNVGRLSRKGDGYYTWFGTRCPVAEVAVCHTVRGTEYWQAYTGEQLRVLEEICRLLTVTYPIRRIVRHSDITSRKADPGPAFPYEMFCRNIGL